MLKKRLLTVALVLCGVMLLMSLLPVHGEEEIYDAVVRLHVLANSDSEEDQALKLEVRDALLEVTAPLLQDCTTRDGAAEILRANEELLQDVAKSALQARGEDAPVAIYLEEESYPQRSYDSVCFPAGTYLSLRVCIGEAEGQNWWCCLFPPLCLGSATVSESEAEDAFISVGMTPSQYKIITQTDKPVYKVRFKILEILESLGF